MDIFNGFLIKQNPVKGTVANRTCHSINESISLKITSSVPLNNI